MGCHKGSRVLLEASLLELAKTVRRTKHLRFLASTWLSKAAFVLGKGIGSALVGSIMIVYIIFIFYTIYLFIFIYTQNILPWFGVYKL